MGEAGSYRVYSGAVIGAGLEVEEVVESFSNLFHISHDQARDFVCNRKLIKKGLNESLANTYRDKINATGLIAVVVKSEVANQPAANDDGKSDKSTVTPPAKKQTSPAAAKEESAIAQLVCPKCYLMQPKSDQCTQCDLVFSKYRDPNANHAPDELLENDSSAVVTGVFDLPGLITKNKSIIALAAGVLLLFFAFALLKTKTVEFAGPDGPDYVQKNEASDNVYQLLVAAEFDSTFTEMGPEMVKLFTEQLPAHVEERGGSAQSTAYIISMVPRAFNTEGAKVSLANWLQMSLNENEIDSLLNMYKSPTLQRASILAQQRKEGTAVHQSFLASYEHNPPDALRRRALLQLARVMGLSEFMTELWQEAQVSLFKLAAASSKAYATTEQQSRTQVRIDELQSMIPMIKPMIKEEAVKGLAWQFENYSLAELKSLHTELDTPVMRDFYNDVRRGIGHYIGDATDWLVVKTVERVAVGFAEVAE